MTMVSKSTTIMKRIFSAIILGLSLIAFGATLTGCAEEMVDINDEVALGRCLTPTELSAKVINGEFIEFSWTKSKGATEFVLELYSDEQMTDLLEAMKADSGIELQELRVDGGASVSNIMMQIQANMAQTKVDRPKTVETTALGAAYLAGLAVGYWASKEDVIKNSGIDRVFEPEISEEERTKKVNGWSKAVKYSYGWAKED